MVRVGGGYVAIEEYLGSQGLYMGRKIKQAVAAEAQKGEISGLAM